MAGADITIEVPGARLAGTFVTPSGAGPHPAALILAGSGEIDRDGDAKRLPLHVSHDLAALLSQHGWASLRFDKRGVGGSTGDYLRTGFYDELDDADAALGWLFARDDVGPVVVVGHSLGASFAAELATRHGARLAGAAMLALTAQTGADTLTWQTGQIARSVPAPVRALLRLLRTDVAAQQRKAMAKVAASRGDVMRVGGVKTNARWMREFIAYDPRPTLRRIEIPAVAVTGSKDVQVNPDDLAVVAALVPGARTRLLADVDHLLRHEPREVSDVRRYKHQVRRPLDPRVVEELLGWLGDLPRTVRPRRHEGSRPSPSSEAHP